LLFLPEEVVALVRKGHDSNAPSMRVYVNEECMAV